MSAEAYRLTVSGRRDHLVVGGCTWLTALMAGPYVVVGWITDGGAAARAGALHALSPTSLLGVVGFGVVLALALTRPGLRPVAEIVRCAVTGPGGSGLARPDVGPVLPTIPARAGLRRLRWAAMAAMTDAAVYATAVLLDGAARSGAATRGRALDDGPSVWTVLFSAVQVLVLDLRAVLAVLVALVVLSRARRPVRSWARRRERRPAHGPPPAARTRRWFPDPPPS